MRLHAFLIVGALLTTSPALAQLNIKKVFKKAKKPYQPPTVVVQGGSITQGQRVRLDFPHRKKPRSAFVEGRVVRGNKDRIRLVMGSRKGHSLHFSVSTASLQKAGVQVDLPAVDLGNLSKGPIRGQALASFLAQKAGKTARRISTYDYAGMKAAVDAHKTVVIDAYAEPATYSKDRKWNPKTNKSKQVFVTSVSEYAHRRGSPRGLVVTKVTDTKKSYENDRWLHRLFDPQSGQYASAGSSTFKYPQTILKAWVID